MKTFQFFVRFTFNDAAIEVFINARDNYDAKKIVETQYRGV